jgi:hypothetical protein
MLFSRDNHLLTEEPAELRGSVSASSAWCDVGDWPELRTGLSLL